MPIHNLTPHSVTVFAFQGDTTFPPDPSGRVARVTQTDVEVGQFYTKHDGISFLGSVRRASYGSVQNLPEFKKGTFYIVSLMTAQAAKAEGRDVSDLYMPGGLVRDAETGQIIGCEYFLTL